MRKKIKIKVALLFFGVAVCAVIGGVCYEGMRFARVTERAMLLSVGDRRDRVRALLGTPTGVCETRDPWAAFLLDVPPERWSYSTSFTDLLHIETSPGPERVVIDFDEHRRIVKLWIPWTKAEKPKEQEKDRVRRPKPEEGPGRLRHDG